MLRLTLPPKTTEVLGDEAAAELAQWVAETLTLRDQSVHRDEYREVLSRLDIIEHDLTGVKERLDAIDTRFNLVDARFDAMEQRFDARFDRMQSDMNARFEAMGERFDARVDRMQGDMNMRFDAMNARVDTIHDVVRSQTRWLVGTLVALGGLISVLMTILEFIQ